jgi:hypothetical protein
MRFEPPRATVRAACLAAVFSLLFIPSGSPCPAAAPPGNVVELSPSLAIYRGPINTGILRDGDAALLIDCGDGSVAGVLPELGVKRVRTPAIHPPSPRPGLRGEPVHRMRRGGDRPRRGARLVRQRG